ncbi:cytidine deaminase [Photorhabdus stackebrandtii]|uniref:Cytidine deaminase n=1 Tax=Photorhabdus stackebrandtii TaxID=1123042 RepID=A0A7X5QJA4_9GAMM|nr:cytidine deaminase [Photorhabdus stackebrandtii]NHB95304.1 cytidine deaminase [Photorhabdus stackebrandtii]
MQARFRSIWAQLPSKLQDALLPHAGNNDFPAMFTAEQAESVKKTCGFDDNTLAISLLPLAAACSLAPISHFNVGAIACGESGNLYFGANMEFTGVPLQQTIHAEQCAIIHAWLRGEKKLTSITINYSPCGHCRQFMNELNSGTQLEIHLLKQEPLTLGDYLPDSFGPNDLGITTLLMDPVNHGYKLETTDKLVLVALDAANRSHAPYSNSYSGTALLGKDGKIYPGRYAENAAFNPSLPPLQAALILMNISGGDCLAIERAVLVEGKNSELSQKSATQSTLAALGCSKFEYHTF